MIYVVQASIGGPVKIGYTSGDAAEARIAQLQAGCPFPLMMLRTMPGTTADERTLHRRFAEHRLHGEWFEPVAEIAEWVQSPVVEIGRTVEPQAAAIDGPLSAFQQKVLDAFVPGEWASSSSLAGRLGVPVSSTVHACIAAPVGSRSVRTPWMARARPSGACGRT